MAKKTNGPFFSFEAPYPDSEALEVSVKENGNIKFLGKIFPGKDNGKEYWRWSVSHNSEAALQEVAGLRFDTKEHAGEFLYAIIQKAENLRLTVPLPQDVCSYLTDRAKSLQEEEKRILSRFWEIKQEKYMLLQFANRNQIAEVVWNTEDSDAEKAVKDLLNYEVYVKQEKKDVAFISEAALYNLIGKDAARTVLSLVHKLCKLVAPNIDP